MASNSLQLVIPRWLRLAREDRVGHTSAKTLELAWEVPS